MAYSIVEYYGKQNGSKCGYCKGTKTSISHGMHAYTMTAQDYQDLIDRGWRRSGHYCYKQENNTTCCPCYTIKCDVLEFKLSKSHKKILKRMNRFLRDGKRDKNEEGQGGNSSRDEKHNYNDDVGDDAGGGGIREEVQGPDVPLKVINLKEIANLNEEKQSDNDEINQSQHKVINSKNNSNEQTASGSMKSLEGINPPCKKAKQMRLERKLAKQAAKGLPVDLPPKTPRNQEKSLHDLINDTRPDDKHKLKIILLPSSKDIYTDTALDLYRKYQIIVHNDSPERLQPKNLQRFCYNSPLKLSQPSEGPPSGYGSFHQQYWLDDKLIAVAVIDILPHCVSSVYFFYDPDYNFLSLGTYSSLREIELVQKLAKTVPSLKYYYMGFYIHSCPKMRYKGKLSPSYLLCPETYTWHLLTDEIREKLDICKYQRFNNDLLAKDANEFKDCDIDSVLLLINAKTYVKYRQYRTAAGNKDRASIIEYSKLVGKTLAHRMLYLKF